MKAIRTIAPWILLITLAMVEGYAIDTIVNALPDAVNMIISVVYLVLLAAFCVYLHRKSRN